MSILDRIIGKKSAKGGEKKPETKKPEIERGDSISTMEIESPRKIEKKLVEKKEAKKSALKKAKAVKPKKEIKARKVTKKDDNIAHKILFENLISEKSTRLAAENKYIFKVAKNAGKFQIKEAVEGYYGVQVVGVNTIRIPAKKRIHGRTIGWKKGFKKAVVTLREGDSIAAVEGV